MFYGTLVWDPWMIVAQIVCLQCLYYLTLGVFLSVLVGTRVSRMSLVYFFDFATLTASTVTGWCVIISFVLSAIAGWKGDSAALLLLDDERAYLFLYYFRWHLRKKTAGYMLYLIERAKKCLDFSATLFITHLFICITYGGWPASINWWVVNGIGLAVMALLGEYLCFRRERKEIPITRYRSNV